MLNLNGIDGVIFDLDGTLVESSLNFKRIRSEIGCPDDVDILEFVAQLPHDQRTDAETTIIKHELRDAEHAKLLPIGRRMLEQVFHAKLPSAIVTRNCRTATRIKLNNNNISIATVITREDAPAKPDPTALINIAKSWDIAVHKILYVGDYIYDQQAAENAGMAWHIV